MAETSENECKLGKTADYEVFWWQVVAGCGGLKVAEKHELEHGWVLFGWKDRLWVVCGVL